MRTSPPQARRATGPRHRRARCRRRARSADRPTLVGDQPHRVAAVSRWTPIDAAATTPPTPARSRGRGRRVRADSGVEQQRGTGSATAAPRVAPSARRGGRSTRQCTRRMSSPCAVGADGGVLLAGAARPTAVGSRRCRSTRRAAVRAGSGTPSGVTTSVVGLAERPAKLDQPERVGEPDRQRPDRRSARASRRARRSVTSRRHRDQTWSRTNRGRLPSAYGRLSSTSSTPVGIRARFCRVEPHGRRPSDRVRGRLDARARGRGRTRLRSATSRLTTGSASSRMPTRSRSRWPDARGEQRSGDSGGEERPPRRVRPDNALRTGYLRPSAPCGASGWGTRATMSATICVGVARARSAPRRSAADGGRAPARRAAGCRRAARTRGPSSAAHAFAARTRCSVARGDAPSRSSGDRRVAPTRSTTYCFTAGET